MLQFSWTNPLNAWGDHIRHRFYMELVLQSLFGLHVHSCTYWLRPLIPPPYLVSYSRALLVSQDRRRLFVTHCHQGSTDDSGDAVGQKMAIRYEDGYISLEHRARIISPLPLRVAKTGRNHLNEEFTPLLPTGIGERF
jgi:hypothetical protein